MPSRTTLTFRHVARSGVLEAHALELASRLQRLDERITRCRVSLEGLRDSGSMDANYAVKIELTVPGARIHADSLHADGTAHSSLYPAMRDAYDNARRQLQQILINRGARTLPNRGAFRRKSVEPRSETADSGLPEPKVAR